MFFLSMYDDTLVHKPILCNKIIQNVNNVSQCVILRILVDSGECEQLERKKRIVYYLKGKNEQNKH